MPMPPALLNWKIKNQWSKGKSSPEANIGTVTHEYADLTAKGKKDSFNWDKVNNSPDKDKILNCIGLFDSYHTGRTTKIIDSEVPVASPTYNFAGTIDVLAQDDEGYGIEDYKTAKGFFSEHFFQTAGGYRIAGEEWLGKKIGWVQINLFRKTASTFDTLRLNPRGWFLNGELKLKDDKAFDSFKAAFLRAVETVEYCETMEEVFKRF
jgi:hypothetical protein